MGGHDRSLTVSIQTLRSHRAIDYERSWSLGWRKFERSEWLHGNQARGWLYRYSIGLERRHWLAMRFWVGEWNYHNNCSGPMNQWTSVRPSGLWWSLESINISKPWWSWSVRFQTTFGVCYGFCVHLCKTRGRRKIIDHIWDHLNFKSLAVKITEAVISLH